MFRSSSCVIRRVLEGGEGWERGGMSAKSMERGEFLRCLAKEEGEDALEVGGEEEEELSCGWWVGFRKCASWTDSAMVGGILNVVGYSQVQKGRGTVSARKRLEITASSRLWSIIKIRSTSEEAARTTTVLLYTYAALSRGLGFNLVRMEGGAAFLVSSCRTSTQWLMLRAVLVAFCYPKLTTSHAHARSARRNRSELNFLFEAEHTTRTGPATKSRS